MARDSRWPFKLFIAIRSIQLFVGIIALICALYASLGDTLFDTWNLLIALATLFTILIACMIINFILFLVDHLLPIVVVAMDGWFCLCLMAAMPLIAGYETLGVPCNGVATCTVVNAMFGLVVISMVLFIGSLVLASIALYKTRHDLLGKKHNQVLPYYLSPNGQIGALGSGRYLKQELPSIPTHSPPALYYYQNPTAPVQTQLYELGSGVIGQASSRNYLPLSGYPYPSPRLLHAVEMATFPQTRRKELPG